METDDAHICIELFEDSKLKANFIIPNLTNYDIYESLVQELLDGLEELLNSDGSPEDFKNIRAQLVEQIIIYTLLQNDITDFNSIQKSQIDEINQSIKEFEQAILSSPDNYIIKESNYNYIKEKAKLQEQQAEQQAKLQEMQAKLQNRSIEVINQLKEEDTRQEAQEMQAAQSQVTQSQVTQKTNETDWWKIFPMFGGK